MTPRSTAAPTAEQSKPNVKAITANKIFDLRDNQTFQFLREVGCRNCRFFQRVNERGKHTTATRGFCLFGIDDYDFGLYISSSYGHDDCPHFILDPQHRAITNKENELNDRHDEVRNRLERLQKRTWKKANHKPSLMESLFPPTGVWETFAHENIELLMELHGMIPLQESDYRELMLILRHVSLNWLIRKGLTGEMIQP